MSVGEGGRGKLDSSRTDECTGGKNWTLLGKIYIREVGREKLDSSRTDIHTGGRE